MQVPRSILALLLVAPIAACSGDEVDELTGPTGLDVRGTYEVVGYFDVVDQATGGWIEGYSCAGTITIPTQNANVFSGTWLLRAELDCPTEFGGTMSGAVDSSDDTVEVDFVIPGRDAAVQAIAGCMITSGPDNTLYGTIDPPSSYLFLYTTYTANCDLGGGMAAYQFDIYFESQL